MKGTKVYDYSSYTSDSEDLEMSATSGNERRNICQIEEIIGPYEPDNSRRTMLSSYSDNENGDETFIMVVGQHDGNVSNSRSKEPIGLNCSSDQTNDLIGKGELELFFRFTDSSLNEAICRLCMLDNEDSNNLVPLLGGSKLRFVDISIRTALEMCTGIHVPESDEFPKNICNRCLSRLEMCWAFRNQCTSSAKLIHKIKKVTKQFCEMTNRVVQSDDNMNSADVKESMDIGENINQVYSDESEKQNDKGIIKKKVTDIRKKYRRLRSSSGRKRSSQKQTKDAGDNDCGLNSAENIDKISKKRKSSLSSHKSGKLNKPDTKGKSKKLKSSIIESKQSLRVVSKKVTKKANNTSNVKRPSRATTNRKQSNVQKKRDLRKNSEQSNPLQYNCLFCDRSYKKERFVTCHVKNCHGVTTKQQDTLTCRMCQKKLRGNMIYDHYLAHKATAEFLRVGNSS